MGAVPVKLPERLAEVLARHPGSLGGMPTASKRSALAVAVWIAAMMPRHGRAGEVEAVLSRRTVQAMMRVGSSTLSLAVWALRDSQVAELLGWEWHPRREGQAWTVTITGWDRADRPQYLHILIGATAPWEVLFYACMSLHAKRGWRVLFQPGRCGNRPSIFTRYPIAPGNGGASGPGRPPGRNSLGDAAGPWPPNGYHRPPSDRSCGGRPAGGPRRVAPH